MTFPKRQIFLSALIFAGLAVAIYWAWRTETRLRTLTVFVESYVFEDAVLACEQAKSSTPFVWRTATTKSVIGLNSYKGERRAVFVNYTLYADGVYCDYDPATRKASIGSNFLERD
jgi:hypothetical protein